MSRPAGIERRRGPRYRPEELGQPVLLVGGRLLNIGPYGLLLEAPVPLSPDSSLRLQLVMGAHRAQVKGRVRGCVPCRQGYHPAWGVGVEFEWMSAEDRERLSRALVPKGRERA